MWFVCVCVPCKCMHMIISYLYVNELSALFQKGNLGSRLMHCTLATWIWQSHQMDCLVRCWPRLWRLRFAVFPKHNQHFVAEPSCHLWLSPTSLRPSLARLPTRPTSLWSLPQTFRTMSSAAASVSTSMLFTNLFCILCSMENVHVPITIVT